MTSIFDDINRSGLSIALSVSAIFSIFLIIDYIEHNVAFALFHENPIIPIAVESEFLTYDDIIAGFSMKYPQDWDRAQHIDKSVTFHAQGRSFRYKSSRSWYMVMQVGSNTTLSTIIRINSTPKETYPDFQIQESVENRFLGHPAHMIIFTAPITHKICEKQCRSGLGHTKAFLVTYKSDNERFSKYLSTIDRMLIPFIPTKLLNQSNCIANHITKFSISPTS